MSGLRQLLVTDWLVVRPVVKLPDVVDLCSDEEKEDEEVSALHRRWGVWVEVSWPAGVEKIVSNLNPSGIEFEDMGICDGRCGCRWECDRNSCVNAIATVYCEDCNCSVGSGCGNRVTEVEGLALVCGELGYGVVTSQDIPENRIVCEYCGVLVAAGDEDSATFGAGFSLMFHSRDTRRRKVYVDARVCGNISRFINHACLPNCRFEEMVFKTHRKMVVITEKAIQAGCQLTSRYDRRVWFTCRCDVCI
jgi:hypothetical protein